MKAEQERREDCRHEVLGFLADRQKLAFPASAIHRRLGRISDFTEEEIEAAAVFLTSSELTTSTPDRLGATPYYQATSKGVLAHERA